MRSTHLRRQHVHGSLLGAAIGEALGYPRRNLDRRRALKVYGAPPLSYQYLRGVGVYGENTRLMILAAQALLNSRNDFGNLRGAFRHRLAWYCLSLPPGISLDTLKVGMRCWLGIRRKIPGVMSTGTQAATRAIFMGPVMHGAGHRIPKWIDDCTKLTHVHPQTVDGCRVLGMLAHYGCTNAGSLDSLQALREVVGHSELPELSQKLSALEPWLADKRSPLAVAREFGWKQRIPADIVPTTVMSVYCFLRYPTDYMAAVQSAVTLGGDAAALGAIVGGLSGSQLGSEKIPGDLVRNLGGSPHGREWINQLALRFAHWPHGAEDLYRAPAQKSYPLRQCLRNLAEYPLALMHQVRRLAT
ncbi:MAG: ADP-ribosylglycohydrolase family protein [bacterium]|nr:ADP-ribosylglycohydrolase family protein [bacterium]